MLTLIHFSHGYRLGHLRHVPLRLTLREIPTFSLFRRQRNIYLSEQWPKIHQSISCKPMGSRQHMASSDNSVHNHLVTTNSPTQTRAQDISTNPESNQVLRHSNLPHLRHLLLHLHLWQRILSTSKIPLSPSLPRNPASPRINTLHRTSHSPHPVNCEVCE